ncbi:MAG: aldehyde dehydrogenase family protein [Ilumatobacteraceae bacterium]
MPLPTHSELIATACSTASRLGVEIDGPDADALVRSPIIGAPLGCVNANHDLARAVERAAAAAAAWCTVPGPQRGAVVRELGEELRIHKDDLAVLVSIETGKILSEGLGEVQEMIDICDLAVGLSRQLHGLTIASERPDHRLTETWHPLGPIGVISAFNFPVAVWSWNAALAIVCGDPVVWKPSERTILSSVATIGLARRAAERCGAPAGLFELVAGGADAAMAVAAEPGLALVSATGSTAMGRAVGPVVAGRFGRALLELGGNNAAVVAPSADIELVVRGVTFSAAGTAGQRCTTLRRLIVHHSRYDEVVERLGRTYLGLPIGDPLADRTLVGPVIDAAAAARLAAATATAVDDGGAVLVGGERLLVDEAPDAYYLRPSIVAMPHQTDIVRTETFGPLLYVLGYDDLDEAIHLNNDVPAGLSSSIFTTDLREAERFCGPAGSDCGIVNVNIGTSGAEIGGAFGGEKETGGGRESGSDAWKAYMRRSTSTVNYGHDLPLAQGVTFA